MNAHTRLLLVPALLLVLHTGCVTDDYYGDDYYGGGYRGGRYYDDYYGSPPPPDSYGYGPRVRHDRDRWDDDRRHRDDRHRSAAPGEFSAGGSAKEYAFPAGQRRCTIEIVDGSVGFRTIVVRRGGAKQSVTINATYQRGQSFDVPIDGNATGIRISDTGRGRYRVSVR